MDAAESGESGLEAPGFISDPNASDPSASTSESLPPISGWVQPGASPWMSRRFGRVFSAIAWLSAILLLTLAGWVAAEGLETASSPWRVGYVAGTIAGGLALATAIRWVWLRIHRQAARPLLSPWIPVVGVFIAASLLGTIGADAFAPAVPTDPRTLFHIGRGYDLVDADPEVVTEMTAEFEDASPLLGEIAVTNVESDDGSIGILVVIDAGATDLTSALTFEGMIIGASKGQPRREVVAGRQTMFIETAGVSLVGWVDAPLIALLYAVDDPTARAMAASVIEAND